MSGVAWLDGVFAPDASVSVHDPGLQRGLGLFETMGAWGGRLPLWERHLDRLRRSAEVCGIAARPPASLRASAEELLRRCDCAEGILRLTVTVAAGTAGVRTLLTCRPRDGRVEPLQIGRSTLRRGLGDWTASHKLTSRAFYELARQSSVAPSGQPPFDDTLIEAADGRPLETTYGNLFVAVDGRLVTPPNFGELLPGVARAALLDALGNDLVTLADIPRSALDRARPFWVTNAVYGPRLAVLPDPERPQPDPAAPDITALDARLRDAWQSLLGS